MTGHEHHSASRNKIVAATFLVSLVTLGAVIAIAYAVGLFGGAATTGSYILPIALSSDRLDFGEIPLHGEVMRQLVVRNDSDVPVTARISAGAAFNVTPDELILHPGISSRISIAVRADKPGSLKDRLLIQFDDTDASPLMIPIEGQAGTTSTAQTADADRQASAIGGPARAVSQSVANDADTQIPTHRRAPVDRTTAQRRPAARSVAMAATPGTAADLSATKTPSKPADGGARKTDSSRARERDNDTGRTSDGRGQRSLSARFQEYDPTTAAPFRSVSDVAADTQSPTGDSEVKPLPSKIPGAGEDGLPEDPPEDLDPEDPFDDDPFDDDSDDDDTPPGQPSLRISGVSSVRVMGSAATFYPQSIPVIGNGLGGILGLNDQIRFPQVPLAFGESMLFAQTAGAQGAFDANSGQVSIQLPIQAVDSDGDAAPLTVNLTTGTATAQNESGILVSLAGSPRLADSGMMRLVAIEKIPVGFKNGGEERLVVFEILASLDFGTSTQSSGSGFGRIGG